MARESSGYFKRSNIAIAAVLLISTFVIANYYFVSVSQEELKEHERSDTNPQQPVQPEKPTKKSKKNKNQVEIVSPAPDPCLKRKCNFEWDDPAAKREPPSTTPAPPKVKNSDEDEDDDDVKVTEPPDTNCTRNLPHAIIIGNVKCGTTAVLSFLTRHPRLITLDEYVEPFFFNRLYHRGFDWYRKKMPCAQPGQLTLEKSANYLWDGDKVPVRIHKYDEDIKLILVACDPIRRAVSNYIHKKAINEHWNPHNLTFEQMAINRFTHEVNKGWKIIKHSIYSEMIKPFLKFFDEEQFHIVDGDRFSKDPISELIKLEQFLEVEPYFNVQQLTRNPDNKKFFCLDGHCLNSSKGRKHPTLDPTAVAKLKDYFRPYNQEFFDMFNLNFNWEWSYGS